MNPRSARPARASTAAPFAGWPLRAKAGRFVGARSRGRSMWAGARWPQQWEHDSPGRQHPNSWQWGHPKLGVASLQPARRLSGPVVGGGGPGDRGHRRWCTRGTPGFRGGISDRATVRNSAQLLPHKRSCRRTGTVRRLESFLARPLPCSLWQLIVAARELTLQFGAPAPVEPQCCDRVDHHDVPLVTVISSGAL